VKCGAGLAGLRFELAAHGGHHPEVDAAIHEQLRTAAT
jgi:hypothetical protein